MSDIFQIVYVSYATEEFLKDPMDNVDDIIQTAKELNAEKNITGLLLYRQGVFLQLLEGNRDDVYSPIWTYDLLGGQDP